MTEEREILVEITDAGPCKKRLHAELTADSVTKEIDANYTEIAKSIQLPGFRKGKVPRSVLERRYAEKIHEDVRKELLETSFEKEVEKLELRVLGEPTFDNVQFEVGQPLRFDAVFEVHPQFPLPTYKGLTIEPKPVEVNDGDVDRELDSLREEFAAIDPVEFGSQRDDDVAEVDLRLLEGDVEHLSREQVYLKIGVDRVDNMVVGGLSAGLRSVAKDGELRFQVEIPEDFPRTELRGRTLEMVITVKSITRSILPAVDEELAKRCGLDSLVDLRSNIRKSLETRRRIHEEFRQEDELLTRLTSELQTELPVSMIDARIQELDLYERLRLARLGHSREDADNEMAKSEAERRKQAEEDVKQLFLTDRIAEEEKIFVTEDDIGGRIQAIASAQNRSPTEVLEEYHGRNRLAELRDNLMREKVRAFIRRKAKVTGTEAAGAP